MKLRSTFLSCGLIAAIALLTIVTPISAARWNDGHSISGGFLGFAALCGTYVVSSSLAESAIKKIKRVQNLSIDDRKKCDVFASVSALVATGLTVNAYVNYLQPFLTT